MNCVHTSSSNTAQCFNFAIKTCIKTVSSKSEVQNSIYLTVSPNIPLAGIMVFGKAGFMSALDFPYHKPHRISAGHCKSRICLVEREPQEGSCRDGIYLVMQSCSARDVLTGLGELSERRCGLNCNGKTVFWTSSYLQP